MYQEDRDNRFYDGYAADRRLRQRLHRVGAPSVAAGPSKVEDSG
ncbi:hypothetical protein PCL1606_34150 [Pseudomonas chlororaphis]|uniref:Uncharacterized protein n=1 Tax=Pseudomonas chlororaphis TaxID=587753 RepID=A0A0D5Y0N9_9PSED|nr:hypothetical protein PCL1606_34150 [Pseudomonas chlororaphis]